MKKQIVLSTALIVVGKTLEEKKCARRFPATLCLRVPGDLKAWTGGPTCGTPPHP